MTKRYYVIYHFEISGYVSNKNRSNGLIFAEKFSTQLKALERISELDEGNYKIETIYLNESK